MDDEEIICVLCRRPIEPPRDYVFRVDGQLEHMECPAPARKPATKVRFEPASDPLCWVCLTVIRPYDRVGKSGDDVVHLDCVIRGPIAGILRSRRVVADARAAPRRSTA